MSPTGISQMRASQLHEALALVDALPPAVARSVRGRCHPKHLAELAQSTRLSWVPIEYGVELAQAYFDVLGERATFEWGCATMLHVTSLAWVRSIRDAAVRIFGLTPRGLFRFAPKFWNAVYRNSGDLVFLHRGEGTVTLVLDDVPKVMLAAPGHLVTMAGAFSAAFDFCKMPGRVTMRPVTTGDRRCTYDAVWDEWEMNQAIAE